MKASHPEVGAAIREMKELTDEIRSQLEGAIQEFKEYFEAGHGSGQ
jgi:hypothetical protein